MCEESMSSMLPLAVSGHVKWMETDFWMPCSYCSVLIAKAFSAWLIFHMGPLHVVMTVDETGSVLLTQSG